MLEAESSLEAEFQAAASEKLAAAAAQPASLSSLFEDEEVVEVDAAVTDDTLLVRRLAPRSSVPILPLETLCNCAKILAKVQRASFQMCGTASSGVHNVFYQWY